MAATRHNCRQHTHDSTRASALHGVPSPAGPASDVHWAREPRTSQVCREGSGCRLAAASPTANAPTRPADPREGQAGGIADARGRYLLFM